MKFGTNAAPAYAQHDEDIIPDRMQSRPAGIPRAAHPTFRRHVDHAYINSERDGKRGWRQPDLPVIHSAFELHPGEQPEGMQTVIADAAIYLGRSLPWVRLVVAPVVFVAVDDEDGNAVMVQTNAEVIETTQQAQGLPFREVIVSIVLASDNDPETFMRAFWAMVMKAYLLEARYVFRNEFIPELAKSVRLSQNPSASAIEKTDERRVIDQWCLYAERRLSGETLVASDQTFHGSIFLSLFQGLEWNERQNAVADLYRVRNEYRKPGQFGDADEWDTVPPLPAEFLPGGEQSTR